MDLHQNARSTPGLAAQSQQGGPPCCGRGAWRVCGSWSPLRPAVAINGPGRGASVVGLCRSRLMAERTANPSS
jgi:hypothetical protein